MFASTYINNTLKYDAAICIGCGRCAEVCPHGVFAMHGRAARLERKELCMECGACELNCSEGAIHVESGAGCAAAMIAAALTGRKESCGGSSSCGCNG